MRTVRITVAYLSLYEYGVAVAVVSHCYCSLVKLIDDYELI